MMLTNPTVDVPDTDVPDTDVRAARVIQPSGGHTTDQPSSEPRLLSLDVLRGIAILLVLGRHPPVPGHEAGVFTPLAYWWQAVGWSGVDLFFVLSGFLIGGLLFKELIVHRTLDIRRFYIRRCFRIWPPYYVCMAAAFLIVLSRNGGDFAAALRVMSANLLHVQNYFWNDQRPVGQSWTLAVEEHFYLALPLLLWLVWRFGKTTTDKLPMIPILAICVSVVCTTWRWIGFGNPTTNFFATHLRMDSLFWGVFVAYLFHFEPHRLQLLVRNRLLLTVIGLTLLSPMFLLERGHSAFMRSIGLSCLYVGYSCLLLVAVHTQPGVGWAGRFLQSKTAQLIARIGVYSYTIYLWFGILGAKPTEEIFRRIPLVNPTLNWLCQFSTFLVFSILGGVLMAALVDKRALKLRDRFFPSRSNILPLKTDFRPG